MSKFHGKMISRALSLCVDALGLNATGMGAKYLAPSPNQE